MEALIYTRSSKGSHRSVEEQEEESRALCERNGWEVKAVVTDLVGASRHSKGQRLGWMRAKKLLAEVDVLVTWESSRAQRDLADYAELRDLCAKNKTLWSYSGRTHDLSTSDGRFRTGLDALLAEREADEIAERIGRAMRANAAKGRPHGRRLYGYQRTYDPTTGRLEGQVPHPTEAPVVRSIFADYLAGVGLRTIGNRLNEQGIRTTKGTPWRDAQVRNLLRRPAYCGRRVFQGQVIGEGNWEPLVSPETFDRVQERLERSAASRQRTTTTARMLTGVARCWKCGGRTFVGHNKGRRVYHCLNRGCLGCARDLTKLDRYVSQQVIRRFETGEYLQAPDDPDDLGLKIDELRRRMDDAIGQFSAGNLTASTLARIEADLLPAIQAAEKERRARAMPLEIDLPDDGDYADWWHERLLPEQRRAICGVLIDTVTILPTRPGVRVFDPESVAIAWR